MFDAYQNGLLTWKRWKSPCCATFRSESRAALRISLRKLELFAPAPLLPRTVRNPGASDPATRTGPSLHSFSALARLVREPQASSARRQRVRSRQVDSGCEPIAFRADEEHPARSA